MPYAIDTAATIADLESAGVEPAQARAIVHAINGAAGDPVSKEDFRELRGEFKELRGEFGNLRGEFGNLRGEFEVLRGEFGNLRGEFEVLRGEFKELQGKFAELREEMDRKFAELREEMDRKFATKADLAMLKSQLTTRILLSQVAIATLLFMLLKFFA